MSLDLDRRLLLFLDRDRSLAREPPPGDLDRRRGLDLERRRPRLPRVTNVGWMSRERDRREPIVLLRSTSPPLDLDLRRPDRLDPCSRPRERDRRENSEAEGEVDRRGGSEEVPSLSLSSSALIMRRRSSRYSLHRRNKRNEIIVLLKPT